MEKEKIQEQINQAASNSEALLSALTKTNEIIQDSNKSLVSAIEQGFKASNEEKTNEVIKSLQNQISDLDAKIKASNEVNNFATPSFEKNEKANQFLQNMRSAFSNKQMIKYSEEDQEIVKSIVNTYDNSLAGFDTKQVFGGEIDYKRTTINQVVNLVDLIPSIEGNNNGSLAFTWYDESYVSMAEANESDPSTQTKLLQRGLVKIHLKAYKSYFRVTDQMILNPQLSDPIIARMFLALERNMQRKLAKDILTGQSATSTDTGAVVGILTNALKSDTLINKVETLASNTLTQKDIILQAQSLKSSYLPNATFLIDKAALYQIFLEEGLDEHYKLEMIDYQNGLARIKTPEGAIPIVSFQTYGNANKIADSDINTYTSLVNGSTINTGFVPGGTNTGKFVSVLADFKSAFALCKGNFDQIGVDNTMRAILEGTSIAGKVSHYGGGVKTEEAISILSIKA